MPNSTQHFIIGAVVGSLAYVAIKKLVLNEEPTLEGTLGWGLAGGVVALVPDVLDAPTSPMHRSFAHSASMLGLLGYANVKVMESPDRTPEEKAAIGTLSLAFASHLVADSTTPAGLPLV